MKPPRTPLDDPETCICSANCPSSKATHSIRVTPRRQPDHRHRLCEFEVDCPNVNSINLWTGHLNSTAARRAFRPVVNLLSTSRMTRAARTSLCLVMSLRTFSGCFLESSRKAQERAFTTISSRSNRAQTSATLRTSSSSPRRLSATVLTSAVRLHHKSSPLTQSAVHRRPAIDSLSKFQKAFGTEPLEGLFVSADELIRD
jgi:hypothetical protein